MNDAIKKWINDNLISKNDKHLIPKRCNKEWFEKTNNLETYDKIVNLTEFLSNKDEPSLSRRMWHIMNDKMEEYKCNNPKCNNTTLFVTFSYGYFRTCSSKCAQADPQTKERIKKTNLKKYGVPHPLMSKEIQQKAKKTNLEKYGFENASSSQIIREKVKQTNIERFGIDTPLRDRNKKENGMLQKYGAKHPAYVPSIVNDRMLVRNNRFYNKLTNNPRFKGLVKPAFSFDEYDGTGWNKRYNFECLKCHTIFDYPLRWGRVPKCPVCFKSNQTSIIEKDVFAYIKSLINNNDILVEENNRELLENKQEVDIYIPSLNLAIELDGLFWHGEKTGGKGQNYHLNKTAICENKNIDLIHIFENEWRNDDDVVKLMIKQILNKNEHIVNLTDYVVKEIKSSEQLAEFLLLYSLDKYNNSDVTYGLYSNKKLLSTLSININNENEIEIDKYVNSTNNMFNKLFDVLLNYILQLNKLKRVIWKVDRRWYRLYKNIINYNKFSLIKVEDPIYYYFVEKSPHDDFTLYSKDNIYEPYFLKNEFNFELSEWENMKNNGFDRIWDCGKFVFELKI